jgi:hypothetical protein
MRGNTGNLGARSSESWQVMASNDRWGEDRRIGELSAMNKKLKCGKGIYWGTNADVQGAGVGRSFRRV